MTTPGPPARRLPIDQPLREAITREVDHSCFVEASAGTGKTSLLVGRILTLLGRPENRAERLVAITFTEKAAAELSTRVRDALQRAVTESDEPCRATLARALEELDRAAITTIHSFCARLLREYPVEAGVSPGFRVLDEIEAGRVFESVWEDWLAAELSREDSALRGPLECGARLEGGGKRGGPGLKEMARLLINNRDLTAADGDAGAESPAERRRLLLREYRVALTAALDEIEAGLANCHATEDDDAWARLREALPRARRALSACGDESTSGLRRLLSMTAWPKIGTSGRKANWRGECLKEIRLISKASVEREDHFRDAIRTEAVREAVAALQGCLAAYARAKAQLGVLDFNDLLLEARNLLRGSAAVRRELKESISHLLVDEYQDTDPLQAEIIFLLAAEDAEQSDWRETRPAPGRLFLVGDPKQSIYRFRRADISVYRQSLVRLTEADARHYQVEANFRTVEPIVTWVNGVFGELMRPLDDAGAVFRPDYAPLTAHRDSDPAPELPAVVRLPLSGEADHVEGRRRDEARRVAALVRHFVEAGGARVWPRSSAAGAWSAPSWGDVALLFRTLTSVGLYEDAFREAGVPYRVDGGRLYFARAEVQGLAALLRAVDNPGDRFSLVAALRSPFFGFDDDTLFVAAEQGRLSWAAPQAGADESGLAAALGRLADWHRRRHELGPARLVELILAETRALEFFSLKNDGEQRVANLLKVSDEARRFTADAGAFRAFVRHLGERETAAAAEGEGESPIQEESDNQFVRFLSVHKSKGLEFPIVILADAGAQPGGVSPRSLVDRAGGRLALSLSFGSGTGHSPGWADLKVQEDAQAEAEAIRLFYVATTRARDLLVIPSDDRPPAKGSFLKMIPPGFEPPELDVAALVYPAEETPPLRLNLTEALGTSGAASADPLGAAGAEFEARRRTLLAALPRPALSTVPAAWPSPAVTVAETAAAPPQSMRTRAMAALVRAVLERVEPAAPRPEPWLDLFLSRDGALGADDRPELLRLIGSALGSAAWARIGRAGALRRDAPFMATHVAEDGRRLALEGRADLIFEEEAGWTAVLYLTEPVPAGGSDEWLSARRGSWLIMALGLSIALAGRLRELVVLQLDSGEAYGWIVDDALLAEAAATLSAAGGLSGE